VVAGMTNKWEYNMEIVYAISLWIGFMVLWVIALGILFRLILLAYVAGWLLYCWLGNAKDYGMLNVGKFLRKFRGRLFIWRM